MFLFQAPIILYFALFGYFAYKDAYLHHLVCSPQMSIANGLVEHHQLLLYTNKLERPGTYLINNGPLGSLIAPKISMMLLKM